MYNFKTYCRYSIKHSILDLSDIVSKAKEDGDTHVVLLDKGDIHSTIYLAKECKDAGLKPVIGLQHKWNPLVSFWAKNDNGLRTLNKISTRLSKQANANLSFSELDLSNLIILVSDITLFEEIIKIHPDTFLELELNEPIDIIKRDTFRQYAKSEGLNLIPTSSALYNKPTDAIGHDYFINYIHGEDKHLDSNDFFLKSKDDFAKIFSSDEIDNAKNLAQSIDLNIELGTLRLPKFDAVPQEFKTVKDYLRFKCESKLKELKLGQKYIDRLNKELRDIEDAQLESYFLIVDDFCEFARKNNIAKGGGRGSAVGSLVCYLLKITDNDPIQYDLIWERFYNAGRKGSLPDIDTDFEAERREEVIEYIKNRWGYDKVFQIITFGSLGPSKSIKAALSLAQCSFEEQNKVTNLIWHKATSIDEAIEHNPRFKEEAERRRLLFNVAKQYEGAIESYGKHAAGIIIADEPFENGNIPMQWHEETAKYISGYDLGAVDSYGLLKIDILGLNTLNIIKRVENAASKKCGRQFKITDIPLDDKKVYESIFHTGNTKGVFQLESSVGQKYAKLVKPLNINDVADLVTLIRPGAFDCLTGDNKILTWHGVSKKTKRKNFRYKTVKELFDEYNKLLSHKITPKNCGIPQLLITSIDENNNLIKNKIKQVIYTGIKQIFTIKLQIDTCSIRKQSYDYQIKASAGHKFLTIDGWKKLSELKNGDYIALLKKRFGASRLCPINGKYNFREIAFQNYQYKCIFCDWDKGSLDVNHLDGNRFTNNKPENLCFMCPNHHRMFSEKTINFIDAKNAALKYKLPNTDNIIYLRVDSTNLLGEEDTYDIEMQAPYHNYIAGGFVVHNSKQTAKYLDVKDKKEDANYPHQKLEQILNNTYGSCIYQEQVIKICQIMAGMTLQRSDIIRAAAGKKKKALMDSLKNEFIEGCLKEGHTSELAELLWSWIIKFSGYSFNKSHAIGYARCAYETAYLKHYYPLEFFEASLNCARDDINRSVFDKINELVNDAKIFDITIRPPSLKTCNGEFAITGHNEITYGLGKIKGIGEASIANIQKCKNASNFSEFVKLAFSNSLKKSDIRSLAMSGALDHFKLTRAKMMADIELLEKLTDKEFNGISPEINGIIDVDKLISQICDESNVEKRKKASLVVPNIKRREKIRTLLLEYRNKDKFETAYHLAVHERVLLGVPLSVSETDAVFQAVTHDCIQIKNLPEGQKIQTLVYIEKIKEIITKKGQEMAFLTGGDGTYTLNNFIVFPRQYEKHRSVIKEGRIIFVNGQIDEGGGIIVNDIRLLK